MSVVRNEAAIWYPDSTYGRGQGEGVRQIKKFRMIVHDKG
jgi:hypothetical protein